jgi:hypothetical protein
VAKKRIQIALRGQVSCSNGAWKIPFVSKFEGPVDYLDRLLGQAKGVFQTVVRALRFETAIHAQRLLPLSRAENDKPRHL